VFFAGEPVHFERFETAEHPRLMHHWLRRLTLPERAHRLHVLVTEHGDDEFGITLQVEQGDQFEPITDWLADTDAPDACIAVLADLAILADYFADAERLYDPTAAQDELIYSLSAFTPILRDILPALRMLGISIILPKALRNLARPQASLSLSS